MSRIFLAICLLLGGMPLSSCSKPSDGIQKPKEITPPPERIKGYAPAPKLNADGEVSESGK